MEPGELIAAMRLTFKKIISSVKSAHYSNYPSSEMAVEHIERVVENSLILADYLELGENEKVIAEIVAQFYDIGRLLVMLPAKSEIEITNHTEASIQFLKTAEAFNQLDDPAQNIIIQVIKHYDSPDLPQKDGDNILFYIKLLRDADKLEAWRATADYINRKTGKPRLAIDLALSDKGVVTLSFCKTIIDGGIPDKSDLVTFNDFIIFQMYSIFDLNFKKSFQILNKKQYMRHLYDSLPKNDYVIEIYRMIRIYIENKI